MISNGVMDGFPFCLCLDPAHLGSRCNGSIFQSHLLISFHTCQPVQNSHRRLFNSNFVLKIDLVNANPHRVRSTSGFFVSPSLSPVSQYCLASQLPSQLPSPPMSKFSFTKTPG